VQVGIAEPSDADIVATMVGELLHEIMGAIGEKAFGFDHSQTTARARSWIKQGLYTVLMARIDDRPVGFISLFQSYALYTEGLYGTIPEFYVRPSHRSQGIGTDLLSHAKRLGRARHWQRLEVTTPPLPQFDRTLEFYQRQGFSVSGGRKMKLKLS